MSYMIPEEFVNDLRHRVDIVEVIRDYLPLKKQGQNFTGLCPFHSEKTPSFVVSPQKQIYHCFGCGKGGHVFSFLMEKNGLSFPEAVTQIAQRCGIPMPMPAVSEEQEKQDTLRKKYYHINDLATGFFQEQLTGTAGRVALEYLNHRGLSQDTREKFKLGLAPASWEQLTRYLLSQEVTEEDLLLLGLAVKSSKGNLIDRFMNRVMFPISNESGRVIGFGGRVLDNSQPKYLNSPETPLFFKGRQLYGLNHAKAGVRNRDQVVIMEGYMDVITAHQNGITHAVAPLGTALTNEQARLLMRYTYNTCICFDADQAGQEATLRGLDVLQQQGCQVTVVSIPQGKDPDDFIREQGGDAFLALIKNASSLLEFKLSKLIEKFNSHSMTGKLQVIEGLLPDLQKVQSPVARQSFIQTAAERLSLPESTLHAELRKSLRGEIRDPQSTRPVKRRDTAVEKAQHTVLHILLETPDVWTEVEKYGGIELFSQGLLKEIYQSYYLIRQAGHNIEANDLILLIENSEAQQLLSQILLEEDLQGSDRRILWDCLSLLKLEVLKTKIIEKTDLMAQYEQKGDVSKSKEMMGEIQQLVQDKQNLLMTLRKGGNDDEK